MIELADPPLTRSRPGHRGRRHLENGLTTGILAVQAVWSVPWLRSFRYGPAEWAWRCLTC
ncbi:DUF418 domain-containing protein [Actinoplanes sp. NPDC089786]|uniref:DUF418 domain-containing protein n=1 Tax=Actinoplanes sp. NPDC089786 TaxID=3155185 RepID=UPI003431E91E